MMNRALIAAALMICVLVGCKSAYYGAWEKMGWAKRDILVDRVEEARDAQNGAKEQFKTTMQKFQELTGFQGGDLEAEYKKLNSAYEDAASKAATVTKKINSVDSVAQDMFKEWNEELSQYSDPKLKASSEQKLNDTK